MNIPGSSPSPIAKSKVHFQLLDALRGIAALWVVLYHTKPEERLLQLNNFLPHWFTNIVFKSGFLGVSIFFVLSGFVIAYSLREAKVDFAYFKNFTLRRLSRLTPPYYAAIVISLVLAFVSATLKGEPFTPMGEPVSPQRLLAHLFYLQEILGFANLDDVYWTLCLEVQFYLVFCALLGLSQWLNYSWNLRFGRAIIFVPVSIIALLYPMGVLADNGRPVIFLGFFYAFLVGVFAYWSWREKLSPLLFYCYSVFLLVVGIINSLPFAVTCAIVAIVLLELGQANRLQNWLSWSWLQFLGKVSYSLYLTHVYILGAVLFLGNKLPIHNVWSDALCLVAAILTCLLFAAIMWQLVEKPSIHWSQKIKLVKTTTVVSA